MPMHNVSSQIVVPRQSKVTSEVHRLYICSNDLQALTLAYPCLSYPLPCFQKNRQARSGQA